MKKITKITWILVLSILIASNLPPVNYFLQQEYHYQNQDGSFTFTEIGGTKRNFDMAQRQFITFKANHPTNRSNQLYRTFGFKPWRFWQWTDMAIHHQRFGLPRLK